MKINWDRLKKQTRFVFKTCRQHVFVTTPNYSEYLFLFVRQLMALKDLTYIVRIQLSCPGTWQELKKAKLRQRQSADSVWKFDFFTWQNDKTEAKLGQVADKLGSKFTAELSIESFCILQSTELDSLDKMWPFKLMIAVELHGFPVVLRRFMLYERV